MDRVHDESSWLVCPGFADELVGCEILEGLQATGEVVGGGEVRDVALELIMALKVVSLDGGLLEGAVHAFDLAVGPWMAWLGQAVVDGVLGAGLLERVRPEALLRGFSLPCFQERIVQQTSTSASPADSHPLTETIRSGLRRAAPADAAAVRSLTREAYAKWIPIIGREPKPMTANYDAAVRDHLVDLLELDGELAALIEMRAEADHLLIVNVAVSPTRQGHGYGRALLAYAEEVARSAGLNEVRLYTNGLFTENLKLYYRVGYRVDREEASHLGVAVYMSKHL